MLLKEADYPASEIEMTSGNYDDNRKLIEYAVPTITTDFCEIGVYGEKTCYFTVILPSASFSKKLFLLVKNQEGIQIYGFKKFLINYFPVKNFSFGKLEEQINSEKYFQIQLTFNLQLVPLENIFRRYQELKAIFEINNIQVINQMTEILRESS